MQKAWPDIAEKALSAGPAKTVPIVAAFDTSEFGSAARTEFCRARSPSFAKVLLDGALGEATENLLNVKTAGFGASIAPIQVFEHESPWCCCFESIPRGAAESWGQWMDEVLSRCGPGVRFLFFLRVEDVADVATLASRLENGPGQATLFCVAEEGALRRDSGLLALGSVCYLLGAWGRFCRLGDLDFPKAFCLGPGNGFVLGIGGVGVDFRYHRARLGRRLATSLVDLWGQQAVRPAPPRPPDSEAIVHSLLPRRGYYCSTDNPEEDEDKPGLTLSNKTFHLGWGDDPDWRPPMVRAAKDDMRQYLGVIEDTNAFLGLIVLPNSTRFIARHGGRLRDTVRRLFQEHLRMPQEPRGLFEGLRARLEDLRAYGGRLAGARALMGRDDGSLNKHMQRASNAIDAIPRMESAFLRLFLIAVGLVWLFIGPAVWGDGPFDWSADVRQAEALGAFSLLCALLVSVPAWHAIKLGRASRAVENATRAMKNGHVASVCRLLVDQIRRTGGSLCADCDAAEREVERVEDKFREMKQRGSSAPPEENRHPAFGDAAVDCAFHPQADALLARTFRKFSERIGNDALVMSPKAWEDALFSESDASAEGFLASLAFDDVASGIEPSSLQGRLLLKSAVVDARKPCLLKTVPTEVPRVLCVTPSRWKEALGDLDMVEFESLPCRDLVAVAARLFKRN